MLAKRWIRAGQVIAALVVVTLTGVLVSGAPSTSTNFIMDDMSTPGAADDAYSTNFHISGTIPQSPAGQVNASSTNFILNTDFVPDTYEPFDTTPPVITGGPTTLYASNTRVVIEWTTDEPATGTVDYGLTTAYGSTAGQAPAYSTLHQVLITGLTPSTTYEYQVSSTDQAANGPTLSANTQFTTTGSPDTTAPTFLTTTVTFLSITSVQIDFTVDEPCNTNLQYGLTTALGTSLPDAAWRTSNSRVISGLTSASTYFFDITATDPSGNSTSAGQQSFTMPLPVSIATTSVPNAKRTKFYSTTIVAVDGVLPLTYSLNAGALPPGLILDGPTGVISGTPTTNGSYNFDVLVTDSGTTATTDTAAFTIVVSSPSGGGGKDDSKCSTSDESGLAWMLLLALTAFGALILRNRHRNA